MPVRISAGRVGTYGPKEFAKFVGDSGGIDVQAGISAATDGLKGDLRDLVEQAGLGERLGRAIGSKVYPSGSQGSLDAAGIVFPRGPKAQAIFDSFNRGVTITAKGNRKFLAIPTKNAGRSWRNGKARPEEFQERTGIKLRFVPLKNGNAVLVGDSISARAGKGQRAATRGRRAQGRAVHTLVFFVLIRSVTIPQRLNFEARAQAWADRIPDLIAAADRGGDQ